MLHYNLPRLRIPTCGLIFLAFGASAASVSILLSKAYLCFNRYALFLLLELHAQGLSLADKAHIFI
jgi:hypothetical protein